jgi:hypothetical protein
MQLDVANAPFRAAHFARLRGVRLAWLLALGGCADADEAPPTQEVGDAGSDGSWAPTPGLPGDGDGAEGADGGPNDLCAWADAKPDARPAAVWFALDPALLLRQFREETETEDGRTNAEELRRLLLEPGGLVERYHETVAFGLAAHGQPLGLSSLECPGGDMVPAALNNLGPITTFYDSLGQGGGSSWREIGLAPWASLDAIAEAIAEQEPPRRNTVVMLVGTSLGGVCFDLTGSQPSLPVLEASVDGVVEAGASVSVLTFWVTLREDGTAATSNMEAKARGEALAQRGQGEAFAGFGGTELTDSLEQFVTDGARCDVTLEGELTGDVCRGEVILGDQLLDCDDVDGFRLRDPRTIELTGRACERLRTEPGVALSARFPCEVFEIF